jgi:hypothetical protein
VDTLAAAMKPFRTATIWITFMRDGFTIATGITVTIMVQ